MKKSDRILIFIIFLFAFCLRAYFILSSKNIPFDYDQVEDIFLTKRKVVDRDFPIIGRAIYGNPALHHGVAFFYFNLIPYLLFRGNPISIALWISLFNSFVVVIIYLISFSLFKNKLAASISSLLIAVSYEMIVYSAWISSTTLSIVTIPLFFLCLIAFSQKKRNALPLSAFVLGLSIQFQLSFIHLIPILLLVALIYKKFLSVKIFLYTAFSFLIATSTMIFTELKLNFAGVRALLRFSKTFNGLSPAYFDRFRFYFWDLLENFTLSLVPGESRKGDLMILFSLIVLLIRFLLVKKKKTSTKGIFFLLLYLFSSSLMILVGYHRKPWFLIGIVPAIPLVAGYVLASFKKLYIVFPILFFLAIVNIKYVVKESKDGTNFFKLERSSLLSSQLEVVDFTYQESYGENFTINTVTYPLYHNALWEYHYSWYGKNKYGYLPGWMGGDQPYPYKILSSYGGKEKIFFIIVDNTYRIPNAYKGKLIQWADGRGSVEKEINNGFLVQKRKVY